MTKWYLPHRELIEMVITFRTLSEIGVLRAQKVLK